MKNKAQLTYSLSVIAFLLLITTCKKDELAKVTKLEIGTESAVTETSASVAASFIDVSTNVTAFGFCYATSSTPTVSDNKTANSGTAKKGPYSSNLTGLSPNTKYFIKAYALEGGNAVYSSGEISFTTGAYQLSTLTTSAVTEVTHNSAISGGDITDDGGQEVTARGVCWNTSQNPTIDDDKTNDGAGTGVFTRNITGLSPNTKYYIRAYATNSVGTAYGNEQNFTTSEAPNITITSPTTGDHWLGLEIGTISWTSNIGGNVSITLYQENTYKNDIVSSTANDGSFSWSSVIDGEYGLNYKVRITSLEITGLYGESLQIKISESNGTIGSASGRNYTYSTVKIGYQWWMAENLKEYSYPDGSLIPGVSDDEGDGNTDDEWAELGDNNVDDASCYYNNDVANFNIYGRLYTYAAAIGDNWERDYAEGQGVCPNGWHLPTDTEWKELELYLGMSQLEADDTGYRGVNEGSKLAGDNSKWNDGLLKDNSDFGIYNFIALPGGCRANHDGSSDGLGNYGYWWSATENSTANPASRLISFDTPQVYRMYFSKSFGFYVRCVRN